MKTTLILLLALCFKGFAQAPDTTGMPAILKKKPVGIHDYAFIKESTPAPDTTEIPAAWKNESIIMLDYYYAFLLKLNGEHEERIKVVYYLRDKWGLDEVSQIYLPAGMNAGDEKTTKTSRVKTGKTNSSKDAPDPKRIIGKVYKKDGSVVEIDASHLIPRKLKINVNNTTGKKSLFSFDSKEGQKLAVPSLEVGDILEINYTTTRYDIPSIVPLVNKYCTMNLKVNICSESRVYSYGSYTNYSSYSVPKPSPRLMNLSDVAPDESSTTWVIERKKVDKYKEEALNDDMAEIPYLIVSYKSPYGSSYSYEFTSMSDYEMKNDQMARVNSIYGTGKGEAKSLAGRINSLLMKKYPKITDTLAYVADAYYMYREIVGGEFVYAGFNDAGYKGDLFFVNVMSRLFGIRDVKHKVFMSQEDHFGPARKQSDFLASVYGIVIPNHDYYLFNPLYNLEPGNIPMYFEDQEYTSFTANKYYKQVKFRWWPVLLTAGIGLAVVPEAFLGAALPGVLVSTVIWAVAKGNFKKHARFDYQTGRFPKNNPASNQIATDIVIHNLKTGGTPLELETSNSFFGKQKISELGKLNYYTNIYQLEKNDYAGLLNKKSVPQTEEEKAEEEKSVKKIFANDLEDDGFDVDKVTAYKFDKANFFDAKAPLVYTVNYKAKNLITEADNYIVMNVGHLIGEQLVITDDAKDRAQDFYLPYQKQYIKNIKIDIPEGYEVQNIEDLNVSKETPAGKFVSVAYVEGNKIIINTTKTYSFKTYEKEKAGDVYDFVTLAQQFRNKKLLLKK